MYITWTNKGLDTIKMHGATTKKTTGLQEEFSPGPEQQTISVI